MPIFVMLHSSILNHAIAISQKNHLQQTILSISQRLGNEYLTKRSKFGVNCFQWKRRFNSS